jgi:hypothetical protein
MIARHLCAAAFLLSTTCVCPAADGALNPASDAAPRLSRADRAAIVDELVERLRADPEILVETLLRFRQAEKADAGLGIVPADAPTTGRPDAPTTVVEFVDYSCEPCRTAGRALDQMAGSGEVRIVHRDLPLTGEGVEISVGALDAFKSTGRYAEFRDALLAGRPVPPGTGENRAFALAVLKRARGDAARLGIKSLPALAILRDGRMEILTGDVGVDAVRSAAKRLAGGG